MTDRRQELAREVEVVLAGLGIGRGAPPEHHDTPSHPTPPHPSIAAPSVSAATPSPIGTAPRGVSFAPGEARLASYIDHTLLKAESTAIEIDRLCDEAAEHRFAAVCVNPAWVPRCADRLRGSSVEVATVIGFPLGANTPQAKAREAELAVSQGATELDMVVALGHVKSGDWLHVADDIGAVVAASAGRLVKVIIESATLTPAEILKTCAIARLKGAHYVKTSTGFHAAGGASAEAVTLMRLVAGDRMGVKASGGVRDCGAALRMIAAGATRIGTSSGVAMSRCVGVGALPMADLLSLSARHSAECVTCHADAAGKGEQSAAGRY